MKLKWKKFTFAISRVWGAGFCAVIYNGDSRSQSCSGIVQTLELMSCCWIRLPRKSAKNLFSKEPSGKENTFTAHQDIQPMLYLHTHRGETAQTLRGMHQQCWRPPRSYLYERSPFQGKSVHLAAIFATPLGSSYKTKSYLNERGNPEISKTATWSRNYITYLKSATKSEITCPMNVVSYAQIAFK